MKLPRILTVPASESQLALALAVCVVLLAALVWGVMWQADIIGYQREVIRWLWNARLSG
jgi:hypothetical protein